MTTTSISIAPEDPESLNFSNENENGFDENENGQESTASGAANTAAEMGMLISDTADDKDGDGEEITFPESSHSFLFTEPVKSIPFVFGLVIVTMSYLCLIIAFIDNFKQLEIPVNVSPSVRVAQYMGILVALLMEEEIPTALFLLKRISKPMLQNQFPKISYWKFVASSILRFSMGYLFLANVVVILVNASDVLEIFYDVLALQFLQQLDDIAFSVSKMEVMGKRLYLATMTPYFATGFKGQKDRLGIGRKIKIFLKAVYLINLLLFLTVMGFVSVKQKRGDYHCHSFTAQIGTGDEVWGEAYVHYPENSVQYPGGKILTQPLLFSNFNGHYAITSRTSEGRPIYVEHSKSDRTPFDQVVPKFNTSVMPFSQRDPILPAEFRYCGGRWLLTHDYIKKSMNEADDSSDCGSWLLRSQPYSGYDLGGASGGWQIWEGEILPTDVSLTCNRCEDNADCNLNGVCNNNGECECNKEDGVSFFGEHCEIKLKDECRNITAPSVTGGKSIWSAESIEDGVFEEYSRPVYTYMEGLSPEEAPEEGDSIALVFSGSRYVIMYMSQGNNNAASAYYDWQAKNFHGFWAQAFRPPGSFLISEPTRSDTPVGVDFFWVGEQQEEYGPFGKLTPVQAYAGLGLFRCDVALNPCQFCSNGITADPSFIVPLSGGSNCSVVEAYTKTLSWKTEDEANYGSCLAAKLAEEVCCPAEWAAAVNASSEVP